MVADGTGNISQQAKPEKFTPAKRESFERGNVKSFNITKSMGDRKNFDTPPHAW